MAILYFSNNADSGTGSLRTAIASAQSGDIIRPDETVFERGATIEITLASTLSVGKNLTIDGGPFRVRLNGGGAIRCASVAANVTATFIGVDFVGGYMNGVGGGINAPGTTDVTFERCGFYGCNGTFGGGAYTTGTTRYFDCVFSGCLATESGGAIYLSKTAELNGVTIAGCVAGVKGSALNVVNGTASAGNSIICGSVNSAKPVDYVGCVVGVASSSVGFVASPPDDLSGENWDLRLLDDASPNPSIYRDSGAVDKISRYDLDGNFRGRETNGATSCSPGAYETLQADLFWIGVEIDPTAPSDLKVADYDAEAKTLILSWTPNLADATGYDVQYSTSGTGWANLAGAAADATSRLCGGLSAARTYIYRIRAYNAVGATAWSTITFTPSAPDEATTETGTREVVSPSWLSADGWAASRFATVSGDVAPQNGDVVFIDGSIAFDGNSLRLGKLVVGGGASLSVDNSSGATLTAIADQFDFGVGSTLRSVGSSTLRFQIGRAVLVSRFGDCVNIQPQFLLGEAAGLEIAPTAKFTTVASSVKLYANGFYTNYNLQITNVATVEGDSSGCENVYVSFQKPTARIAANGTPRVACGLVKWTTPSDATSDFTALETGSAPIVFAPRRSATVAGSGSHNDFLIDVSNAQPSGTLALTLIGQKVYGDAPSSAVALIGNARIDERGLTSQTLTPSAGATLNVDGGKACVATLNVVDGAKVEFSGVDAVLTATESATVGAATFSGAGYFATPQGTDLTAATFETSVRRVDFGANVETFAATATGPTTATLAWRATDATARVCVERENAASPNGWEVVAITPTEDASPLEVALNGKERFRIFDGATFRVDSAWFSVEFYQCRTVSVAVASADGGAGAAWEASAGGIMFVNGKEPKVGENCCIYAKIKSPISGTWVPAERVASVEATVWRTGSVVETTLGAVAYRPVPARTVVPGWDGVALPPSLVLEAPVLPVEPPVADETEGYNFVWAPDVSENPIFPESGTYRIQVVITLDDGTQVYLTEDATVKNR
ncbi:MAG: fibronectin type III domain-containing protein [Thermoguttaceae bacterium]|nr:fibronectin type III domain-containing protein [Thermoguttaceae bacterium]